MTAFTVNGGAITNWESLTGGSVIATLDTYAISNNTTLLINTDSYLCTNHSLAFGSLDTVTYSGVGGKVHLDGSSVRVMAYNTGTGNVPAIGATISQGGVTGYFLGVWSGWQVEPTASGAAMPATGFIKFKNKAGGNFAAGALTGIGASATEADRTGWIEVRGADTASITVPRIGKFVVNEGGQQWFELGTTNGARNQIIPCPTTGNIAGIFGGVWIETAAGSGVYERFAGAGSMVALSTAPTDERGKIVWQTTGGIRIGFDGTNNVGFLPPTGCKVRIPNVIMTCCTRTAAGSGLRVLPNATLATRQEFIVTSAGDISLNSAVMQWYGNFLQAFKADVLNSVISDSLVLQEIASPINVNNVIVAPTQAQLNFALNMVSCFGGGNFQNANLTRFSLAASGAYVNVTNYNKNIVFTNVKSQTLLNRGNATTGTWTDTQNVDCSWVNCTNIGGRALHVGAQRPAITNNHYADNFSGATTATNPHYAQEFTTGCVGAKVDGVDFLGLTNVHPYNGIMSISACYNSTLRNVGTYAAPLDFGSANASGVLLNGAGNNDGIRMQRLYCLNTRTGAWAFVNSDNGVEIQDVKADYADTTVVPSLNTITKAVSLIGATTGQVSVYGTHWKDSFTSATVGKLEVSCNEPTTQSSAQCVINSGTPQFNSAGQIAMTVVGQQVTWEMPHFAKGHTALANLAPTLTGTNTGNLSYEFQCDKGAGGSANAAFVQSNSNVLTGSGTTIAVTLPGASSAGSTLIFSAQWSDSGGAAPSSVMEGGNNLTLLGTVITGGSQKSAIYILNNITAGTKTVTLTLPTAAPFKWAYLAEFSGLAASAFLGIAQQAQTSPGTGADGITSGTLNGVPADAILVATTFDTSGTSQHSAGAGFTYDRDIDPSNEGGAAEYRLNVTAGNYAGTFTQTSNNNAITHLVSLQKAAGGGGGYGGTWLTLNAANLTAQGAINPAIGIRVKVRATCVTANAGNLLTNIAIPTVTTSVAQGGNPYPLDTFVLTLSGIQTGSDVVIRQAGTTNVLETGDGIVGSSYNYTYETPQLVDIFFNKNGYVPYTVYNYLLASQNVTLPVSQDNDRNFT